MAGLSSLTATASSGFKWTAQSNLTGAAYTPVQNTGSIAKSYNAGTTLANNVSGGADQVFSFQQGIVAGGTATLDLTAMTNLLLQTSVSIARIKSYQIRLLSATDDATITPAPNANSTVLVTNNGPATPAVMDFGNGGSGLTLVLTAAAGAITGVTIGAAGSGYPASYTFNVIPIQAGGSGGVITVTTNGSGVPTTVAIGAAGAGYTSATVPSTPAGHYLLTTGNAHMSIDVTAAGVLVSSTTKNLKFINMDATHAVTLEVDVIAGTT